MLYGGETSRTLENFIRKFFTVKRNTKERNVRKICFSLNIDECFVRGGGSTVEKNASNRCSIVDTSLKYFRSTLDKVRHRGELNLFITVHCDVVHSVRCTSGEDIHF